MPQIWGNCDNDLKQFVVELNEFLKRAFGRYISWDLSSWFTSNGELLYLEWTLEDEHIIETPFYRVLNICRVFQLLDEREETVHSKDEGGQWGLTKYEKWEAGHLLATELQELQLSWYGVEEFTLLLKELGYQNIICSANYVHGRYPTASDEIITFEIEVR